MPRKETYWKDPEHHKAYARARQKRLIAKGLAGGENPALHERDIKASAAWNKANRVKCNAADMRYWKKLVKEAGGWSRPLLAEAKRKRREAKLRRIREARQML